MRVSYCFHKLLVDVDEARITIINTGGAKLWTRMGGQSRLMFCRWKYVQCAVKDDIQTLNLRKGETEKLSLTVLYKH